MAKYVYPAVFTREECGFSVSFPDVPSCYTSGETLTDAIEMANDVLSLIMCEIEDDKGEIPVPTDINKVLHSEKEFVTLITCDTVAYRKLYGSQAVKKTLSIPAWLNTKAEQNNINFSQLLQTALKNELHIQG